MDSRTEGRGKCGRVVIIFVGKQTQYVHGSRGRWPHILRKQVQYRHVHDGYGGVPGRGTHQSWNFFDVLSSYFEQNRHRIHTEQDSCGTYLNQNRHSTDMDTTVREVNLGDHTFNVDIFIIFLHVTNTRTVSRGERKLDRLKRESKGAAKEAPTCAVPMHA